MIVLHSTTYAKILILGDFNVGIEEQHMKAFCDNYNLTSLIKQLTCYKNPNNPTCIDLILSNTPRSFQSTCVIETGLSDFHLMTLTVMKKSFRKFHPRLINYRSYKDFSNEAFRECLLEKLSKEIFENNDEGLQRFCDINLQVLNQHAPQKIKYVRGNQMPFMTKQLSKEIMKRSRLRNNFLRNRTEENKILYNRQRNYCVSLLRKSKRGYYENLNIKNVTDNKLFWKSVKPLLSDKSRIRDRINISEKGKILKTESETAESLNSFFSNIVKNLNVSRYSEFDPLTENIADPTLKAIFKCKDHPSILAIQSHCEKETFRFSEVNIEDIKKDILKLDKNEASQHSDIPIKIIKENLDIFAGFLCTNINSSFKSSSFPSCLKMADVTPLHKKGKKDLKENYRPVSILQVFSKVFERSTFAQMSSFFDNFLSKQQCGFRKGYSTQQCLLALLEKWKRAVDSGQMFGALLTDLSKAFDCLDHELLIAKLNAYGFSLPALKLVHDYLSNRKQRTQVNKTYSSWLEIVFGVPQGCILDPLLFNIFLADLFFILNDVDIASYADDNTPYVIADDINGVITSLEQTSKALFEWFENNLLKSNADKCHLLVSSSDAINLRVSEYDIKNNECEKLLGVKFDNKLTFEKHITDICRKASRKIYALARIAPYMDLSKRRMVMNAFFNSQFNYCPLIWMCHNRTTNRKINRLHERCLRIIYNDKQSSFKMLLEKDSSVSIHDKNIQCLATEMYKVSNGLSPPIVSNIFTHKNCHPYNLRLNSQFSRPLVRSVPNVSVFKNRIKKWKPENCPCRLCKTYISRLGFT